MNYEEFVKSKVISIQESGCIVNDEELNKDLFDYQKKIIKRALSTGKYAIFADCGLGKTIMQLEFARIANIKTGKPSIIYTPLAVGKQTELEGKKFGIECKFIREREELIDGINIINYDRMHYLDDVDFGCVVLDESSIIKSFSGKIRNQIIEQYRHTHYKLACTATPSPNDFVELGNHCEFLNVMSIDEMLAMFFINDVSHGDGRRLKGHSEEKFWQFVGSRAVMIKSPCDLGDNVSFVLPKLHIHETICQVENDGDALFVMPASGMSETRDARKKSIPQRLEKLKETMKNIGDEQVIIRCDYNYEQEEIKKIVEGYSIQGSDSPERKEKGMIGFSKGEVRVLITKPQIAGFGMNWQNCHNMIFFGISDSYERYYQAIRRCWRYGQKEDVNVYIIIGEKETGVLENVMKKSKNHEHMFAKMSDNCLIYFNNTFQKMTGNTDNVIKNDNYTIYQGDCVQRIREIDDNSVDFSVFSPPFSDLYTYSDSELDMGNCKDDEEFYKHFTFLVKELYRVIKPGRLVSFHCMNLPTRKTTDGFIGIKDFRGDLIRMFQDVGFYYHSEVTIRKDPVVAMQRTKALGLLHKQIKKDSSMSRQGIPDYVVTMRKPGKNKEPITHTAENFPVDYWQKIASPVRMDINQSDTLQHRSARDHKDEKHICPLQLDVIRRLVYLWSNPGDTVLSPFMGIGSEGFVSLELQRRFIGIELKQSYFEQASRNLQNVSKQQYLFV